MPEGSPYREGHLLRAEIDEGEWSKLYSATRKPHAIGSAKTTTARVLKRLVDPSAAEVRCGPREARDLMIQGRHGWVLAFDNRSGLPGWLSDALCRLAPGGGFGNRRPLPRPDPSPALAAGAGAE